MQQYPQLQYNQWGHHHQVQPCYRGPRPSVFPNWGAQCEVFHPHQRQHYHGHAPARPGPGMGWTQRPVSYETNRYSFKSGYQLSNMRRNIPLLKHSGTKKTKEYSWGRRIFSSDIIESNYKSKSDRSYSSSSEGSNRSRIQSDSSDSPSSEISNRSRIQQ